MMKYALILSALCLLFAEVFCQSTTCAKINPSYTTIDGSSLTGAPPNANALQYGYRYYMTRDECIQYGSSHNMKALTYNNPNVLYLSSQNTTTGPGTPSAWEILPGSEVYLKSFGNRDNHGVPPFNNTDNPIQQVCYNSFYYKADGTRFVSNFLTSRAEYSSKDRHCYVCDQLAGCVGYVLNPGQCYIFSGFDGSWVSTNLTSTTCYKQNG